VSATTFKPSDSPLPPPNPAIACTSCSFETSANAPGRVGGSAANPERAVRLALDMRRKVDELAKEWARKGHLLGFGIGIASGYATIGQVGFEHRREYTANGSVINLASRLCDEAKPGQIVISQRAFAAVERWVGGSHIGQLSLKGFSRPIDAYEVVSWDRASGPS
jgi:class 3 adenylate cyclase